MDPITALMMYDKAKDILAEHGVDLDKGAKSLVTTILENPMQDALSATRKAWDDAQISEEELEDALKSTPYEDGDFEIIYEDSDGDGDIDAAASSDDDTVAVDEDITSTGETDWDENKSYPEDKNDDAGDDSSDILPFWKKMVSAVMQNRVN